MGLVPNNNATLNHNTHCEVASVSNQIKCETNAEAFKCKSLQCAAKAILISKERRCPVLST